MNLWNYLRRRVLVLLTFRSFSILVIIDIGRGERFGKSLYMGGRGYWSYLVVY